MGLLVFRKTASSDIPTCRIHLSISVLLFRCNIPNDTWFKSSVYIHFSSEWLILFCQQGSHYPLLLYELISSNVIVKSELHFNPKVDNGKQCTFREAEDSEILANRRGLITPMRSGYKPKIWITYHWEYYSGTRGMLSHRRQESRQWQWKRRQESRSLGLWQESQQVEKFGWYSQFGLVG